MKKTLLLLTLAAALCCSLPLRAQQPAGTGFGVYKAGVDELIRISEEHGTCYFIYTDLLGNFFKFGTVGIFIGVEIFPALNA